MDTEEQVAAILADWSERQQSGDHVDPEDVIRSHPELTALLRDGFAALEYVDAAVGRVSASPPAPAKIGPYRIRRQLGVGGMGTVYLGETDEAEVAVKVIHPHLLQTPGYFKRFLREAELPHCED